MTTPIPDTLKDLFERPITVALATVLPDGQPQVTPVWFMHDGEFIIINTARGRQKDRNMSENAKVTVSIIDPQNPYHWAEVRGYVAHITEEGAEDVIRKLALRYRGTEDFKVVEGDVRVTYKIGISKINGQ
jgi:PPOX class probable F420-dependent enzyme